MHLQVSSFFEIHITILRNFVRSLFTHAYMFMKGHASRVLQFLVRFLVISVMIVTHVYALLGFSNEAPNIKF